MIYLEDGSIDTIERLYRTGVRDFTSYGIDEDGDVVKVDITDLHIDETQISTFHHVIFDKYFELVCDPYQKVMMNDDRSFKWVKRLSVDEHLKCKLRYTVGNLDDEFIDTSIGVMDIHTHPGRCHEPVYTFESSMENILIPQVMINTLLPRPFQKPPKCFKAANPSSIKFICIHDMSFQFTE